MFAKALSNRIYENNCIDLIIFVAMESIEETHPYLYGLNKEELKDLIWYVFENDLDVMGKNNKLDLDCLNKDAYEFFNHNEILIEE